MSQHNEVATDPGKHKRVIAPWLKNTAPLIYLYGPSGAGKTTHIKQLISHRLTDGARPYAPVLYIDLDNGHETVGAATQFKKLCKLWAYDGRYDEMLPWFYAKMLKAEHVKCGAIVIEGLSALFKSLLTPEVVALPSAKGTEVGTAHIGPSMRIDTAFETVKQLKLNRNAEGCGVPIFVTLNTREVAKSKGSEEKMHVPDFSPNRTRAAMRTADGFIEIAYSGSATMRCTADHNKFRKLRNEAVALQVEDTFDLNLPGLLKMMAFSKEIERRKLAELLASEDTEALPASPEPQA